MNFKLTAPGFSLGKKIFLNIMRTFILLFFGTAFSFAPINGLSQNTKITLKEDQLLSVDEVFEIIEEQTPYHFIYRSGMFKDAPKVKVKKGKVPIEKLLKNSFLSTKYSFEVRNNNIIITKESEPVVQQLSTITGTVTDGNGVPLPGVNVTVKGTSHGTSTDFDGKYEIEAEQGQVLNFSSVGFKDQEITVGDNNTIDVTMEEGSALDEVVVIGYGTQKAKDVSTAISSVSSENFNKGVINNPIEQIQGRLPGLEVTRPSGDPNENLTIRLRGQASLTGGQDPLVVLNGVPLTDINIISNIPPGDIESYTVLKDAAATAVYGARGANGVILIETKKGKKGKSEFNYTGDFGISTISKKYDMLNAQEWKEASLSVGTSESTIENRDAGGDTDWMEALTRTAITTSHNLSMSGGSDDFNYYGSINYLKEDGIVVNSGKKQIGINFQGEKTAFDDKLNIKLGILNTNTKLEYTDRDIFNAAANDLPVYPVYNKDGSFYTFSDFRQYNPVLHQEQQVNKGEEEYTVIHGKADYKLDDLIEGLSFGVTGSISRFSRDSTWFKPSFPVENNINSAKKSDRHRKSIVGDVHINYSRDWGKHHIDASFVHEYSDYSNNFFNAAGQDYAFEDSGADALQGGDPQFNKIKSHKDRYNLSSFLGRVSYNYYSKYYLNFSFRRDGSSKFGKNNRWGNFPAVSLAWRLSSEKFLKDAPWINELKLRAGYGVTGNQDAIDPYRTQRLLSGVGRYYNAASDNYPIAYGPSQNENPDLKWEEIHEINIGLDFGLFSNKLQGNFNLFNRKTKNLLFNYRVPVPPFQVNNILANVGELQNKGIELQLKGSIINNEDFTWSAMGQITVVDSKIKSLSGTFSGFNLETDNVEAGSAIGRGLNQDITYLKEGYAPYVFYLPHYEGVDENGKQLFSDGEGGQVTQEDLSRDMYRYIDPSSDFSYGFGSTLTFKNWALNFFFRGVSGQKIFNNTRLEIDNISGRLPGSNMTKRGVNSEIMDESQISDLWLEKAGFLRLDNLTLSYTFDNVALFENLQLSITANNLFVITSYHGLDPEIRVGNVEKTQTDQLGTMDQSYIDSNYGGDGLYPKVRSFSLGLNVSF